jgi:hypothetical protein
MIVGGKKIFFPGGPQIFVTFSPQYCHLKYIFYAIFALLSINNITNLRGVCWRAAQYFSKT